MMLVLLAAMVSTAPSPAVRCETLRAVSYNIRLDTPADGDNRWDRRRHFFVEQLRLIQPDVLGLQEVVEGQMNDLKQAMPDYRFVGVARDDGRTKGEYSPLAINRRRFSVTASGTFWLSATPDRPSKGWDAAYIRIASWARVKSRTGGAPMLLVNTHLDNEGAVARREGARQIRRWIDTHRRTSERVIMLGDLNSQPTDEPLAALTSGGSAAALRDAHGASRSAPIGSTGTFNAFQPRPVDSKRIDYILADARLRVDRYAVLNWSVDERVASDHFPVIADLSDLRCAQRRQ